MAEIKFGCGLSPTIAQPSSIAAMLAGLQEPDAMVAAFPIERFDTFRERMVAAHSLRKKRRDLRGTPEAEVLRKDYNLMKKSARQANARWFGQTLLRRTHTTSGLRERLVAFWADHFTAFGKVGLIKRATPGYIEDAIRPHISGRFEDLLWATVTHPLMLHYLDQDRSAGPSSKRALRSNGKQGMNENLAREVLELHTLGAQGGYDQRDVRQLAELLTGLTSQPQVGFKFRKDMAEPGAETILGVTYGAEPGVSAIRDALGDLARHPATAGHIARKIAVHFVSDDPDPALVAELSQSYLRTNGDLTALYTTLLEHPAAWQKPFTNMKWPMDFVGSALRALAVPPDAVLSLSERDVIRSFHTPMRLMGQRWQTPAGPDGWDEADSTWITPQGLAARVDWAMRAPEHLLPALPDPRRFVDDALGRFAPENVRFAARAAERRAEAIGLVLSSPSFQRH